MFFGAVLPIWIAALVLLVILPIWAIVALMRAADRADKRRAAHPKPAAKKVDNGVPATRRWAVLGRMFTRATLRPRFLGMALDLIGLAAFAATMFTAFKTLDYWAFEVPVTPAAQDLPHVDIYGPEDPEAQFLFSPAMMSVKDPTEFCCDMDDVVPLGPKEVVSEGYKVVYLRRSPIYPATNTIDRRRGMTKLTCSDAWGVQVEAEAVFAHAMRAVQQLPAEFPIKNWHVQTEGLRDTEMYINPAFWATCNGEGGCMTKHIVLGNPNRSAFDLARRAGRYDEDPRSPGWEAPQWKGWDYLRETNPYLEHDTYAFIVDPKGLIRATLDHKGTEPALQILSALRAVVEADGRAFPDEIRPYHLTGGMEGVEHTPARWGEPVEWAEADMLGTEPPDYGEWVRDHASGRSHFAEPVDALRTRGQNERETDRAERENAPALVPERWRFGLVTGRSVVPDYGASEVAASPASTAASGSSTRVQEASAPDSDQSEGG